MPLSINPRDARDEQEVLADLRALTASPGYVHALAFLSWRDNYIGFDAEITPDDMAKSYGDGRLLRSEFVTIQGMMIKSIFKAEMPDPETLQNYIDKTIHLMGELHASFNKPMMQFFEDIDFSSKESPFTQAKILREPIFYGGESANNFQYSSLSLLRYSSDDEWLVKNVGFSAQQMCDFVIKLNNFQEDKLLKHSHSMAKKRPEEWTFLPAFVFSPNELAVQSGISSDVIANLIRAFSAKLGENSDFVSIGDFNVVSAKPIIDMGDGTYVCLETYTLAEAIYDSPYYWMQADHAYKQVASRNRGRFTEEFTRTRMEAVFGQANVFQNVNIEGKKGSRAGEVDILVKFGDRALVIQCKSKKLTLEARRGNDGQLKSDFKNSVQNSYDQAISCISLIKSRKFRVVSEDGTEIDVSQLSEFYPVCVTSESPSSKVVGRYQPVALDALLHR